MKKACHLYLKDLIRDQPALAPKALKVTSAVTCIKYKSLDLQVFLSTSAIVPIQHYRNF